MKYIAAFFCFLLAASAQATVGVAMGANKFAADNLPEIKKGEQVRIFYCHGKNAVMSGPQAMQCAVDKCLRHFNLPQHQVKGVEIIGGHCKADSYSERKGFSIGAVGEKGDNTFIFTKSLSKPSRQEAYRIAKEGFPLKDKNIVFDFYDDGSNGVDSR